MLARNQKRKRGTTDQFDVELSVLHDADGRDAHVMDVVVVVVVMSVAVSVVVSVVVSVIVMICKERSQRRRSNQNIDNQVLNN
jgi:heme/copper-type cytochrome/quinol oxidase subunit 2